MRDGYVVKSLLGRGCAGSGSSPNENNILKKLDGIIEK